MNVITSNKWKKYECHPPWRVTWGRDISTCDREELRETYCYFGYFSTTYAIQAHDTSDCILLLCYHLCKYCVFIKRRTNFDWSQKINKPRYKYETFTEYKNSPTFISSKWAPIVALCIRPYQKFTIGVLFVPNVGTRIFSSPYSDAMAMNLSMICRNCLMGSWSTSIVN